MQSLNRKRWTVGSALFFINFIAFGASFYSPGVFLIPLTKEYHWSRFLFSMLITISGLASLFGNLAAGWILDRFKVKPVIVVGVTIVGLGLLLASWANSYGMMVVAFVLMGVATSPGTLIPTIVLVTRSYGKARGRVMGLTIAGESLGGMTMTILAAHMLADHGWRTAYVALAAPVLLIALPLAIFLVEDLPQVAEMESAPDGGGEGYDLREAMGTRSFWLLAYIWFAVTFSLTANITHVIPFLVGMGYAAGGAAAVWSAALLCKCFGQLGFGSISDWITARMSLVIGCLIGAVGIATLFAVRYSDSAAALFAILGGGPAGIAIVVNPVAQVETLGAKRFGSIQGVLLGFGVVGGMLGAPVLGRIYDAFGGYRIGYLMLVGMWVLAALCALGCVPMKRSEAQASLAQVAGD